MYGEVPRGNKFVKFPPVIRERNELPEAQYVLFYIEAGRPPECSFLLIYEIEISQVITSFHHHIKT